MAKGVWGGSASCFVLSDIVGEYPKNWALPRKIDLLSAFAQVSILKVLRSKRHGSRPTVS